MKLVAASPNARWLWSLLIPAVSVALLWGYLCGSLWFSLLISFFDWMIVSVWVQAAGCGYFLGKGGRVVSRKKSPFSFWLILSFSIMWYWGFVAAFVFALANPPSGK
jgi:hypothetical protein